MRRDAKILLSTAVIGALALWGERVPEAVTGMHTFRVDPDEVEIRGLHYLSESDAVELLAVQPTSSVWEDPDVWEDRLEAHPLVRSVRVRRRLPNGLLAEVTERRAIALAPTPTLEPVDAEGYRLPLDPAALRLDLPLIATDRIPPERSRVFPEGVRLLAAEVEHLMASDTAFIQRVSSVEWIGRGAVLVRWTEPSVDFFLPSLAPPQRLREGLVALADATAKTPDRPPSAIDLRFADQVVVRRNRN